MSDRFILDSADQQIVGELQVIEARYEDTFVDIARSYTLGYDELVEANPGVDPWLPGAGVRIVLPTRFVLPDAPRDGIVINLASKRLFWYPAPVEDGPQEVVTFPIGIGQFDTPTPEGTTTVVSKARDPVWIVPRSILAEYAAEGTPLPPQVPPGPDNPLGRYMLGLGLTSYLIHGTNRPAGVGMRVSHGCVRLFPENIEFLFDNVEVGVPVYIVNQPFLVAWDEGRLWFESHAKEAANRRDRYAVIAALFDEAMGDRKYRFDDIDLHRAGEVAAEGMGIPLPVLARDKSIAKVLGRARVVNNLAMYPGTGHASLAAADLEP